MRRTREGLIPTNWYVITGAPSSGTTSLVNRLALMGYMTVPEAARAVIDQGFSEGKTLQAIRADESQFQIDTADLKRESHATVPPHRLTFWVRGKDGDTIAFWPHSERRVTEEEALLQLDSGPEEIFVTRTHLYRGIFICDTLPVQRDYARIESDQRVSRIDQLLEISYKFLGYRPIRVPVSTVDERAKFVLSHIPKRMLRYR